MYLGAFIVLSVFAFASWTIATLRGDDWYGYFVIGLFLGPFGLIYSLFSGKPCIHCKKRIHLKADTCPKCHRNQFREPKLRVISRNTKRGNKGN